MTDSSSSHPPPAPLRRNHAEKLAFVTACAIVLFTPPLVTLLRDNRPASLEKRALAPLPKLTLTIPGIIAYRTEFERYWTDNFGLRNLMVRWHSLLNVVLFRTSSSPQVLLGRNGWLFYTGDGSLDDLTSSLRLSPEELDRWRTLLAERSAFVRRQGGHYVLVVVPSKHSIYTNELPRWTARRTAPTRLDQLLASFGNEPPCDILDLRPPLRDAARHVQVYFRTDTHWTRLGAYLAYKKTIRHLRPRFPGLPLVQPDRIERRPGAPFGGDLAVLLTLPDRYQDLHGDWTVLAPPVSDRLLSAARTDQAGRGAYRVTEQPAGAGRTALVFHDSYIDYLQPFLSQSFRKLILRWQPDFDARLVIEHHPDLVIHEVAERFLGDALRENPPEISREYHQLRRDFEVNGRVVADLRGSDLAAALRPQTQAVKSLTPEGLVITASGPDPSLLLTGVALPRTGIPVLRLQLTCPAPTSASVFFQPATSDAQIAVSRYVREGPNDVLLALPPGAITGLLRIDPGQTSGAYVLSRLQIRTLPQAP